MAARWFLHHEWLTDNFVLSLISGFEMTGLLDCSIFKGSYLIVSCVRLS